MKCNAVNSTTPTGNNSRFNAAKRGALITSGVLGASTGISWVTKPDEMRKVVRDCGGRNGYVKNFIIGGAVFMTAGAILNTAFQSLSSKIIPKSRPKAVN